MSLSAETDRAFGLLLFEAEESLARGSPDRSLVLSSKAVKERPESLIARSLFERARREILHGKRREKLEARVREAEALLARGDLAAAEKIVGSALKLLPDHAMALELLGRIRDARTQGGTAEAEAEMELLRLARDRAHKAAEAARAALAQGWNRQAFLHVRRGLSHLPDHPELLSLLRETQGALENLAQERTRRRALLAQLRDGLDLLSAGDAEGSLRILRAVLAEDPDNPRAQAAVQEVRKVLLRGAPAPVAPVAPRPEPHLAADPPPAPQRRPLLVPPRQELRPPERSAIPVEILLPRTRRRATPIPWVLGGAAAVLGIVLAVAGRSGRIVAPPPSEPSAALQASAAPETTLPGPLTNAPAALRDAVDATLADYAKALERADADLLARCRPDLSASERQDRLAPFVGALNASADLRVLDLQFEDGDAVVTVLATYVIVDGRQAPKAPEEETLRFSRKGETWALRPRRGTGP